MMMRKVIVLGCVLAAIAITLNSASEISIVGRGQHIADNLAIIRLVLDN
jgi:DNA-binding protein